MSLAELDAAPERDPWAVWRLREFLKDMGDGYDYVIIDMPPSFSLAARAALAAADEVIVSSSGDFCMAACEIDGKPVGGKAPALLQALQDQSVADFRAATENQ